MKVITLFILGVAFLCACGSDENAENVPFQVEYVDSTHVEMSEVLDLGKKPSALQGLAVYGNRAYQFYSSSACKVFDLGTKENVATLDLPEGHYGSAEFSSEFENDKDEVPLLYVGGQMTEKQDPGYVVVNLNTQSISKIVSFDTAVAAQVLCAFDFRHGTGYSFGYVNDDIDHEAAPYEVTPFDIETGKCDLENRFSISNEGHLQDAFFKDGRIYVITGWNKQWNGMDVPIKIFAIDPVNKRTTMVMTLGYSNNEGEGIAWYNNGFLITARKLYRMYHVKYQ